MFVGDKMALTHAAVDVESHPDHRHTFSSEEVVVELWKQQQSSPISMILEDVLVASAS